MKCECQQVHKFDSMIISITFSSMIICHKCSSSHKTSHDRVTSNSHVKAQTINFLENQQTSFLVIKQLQFILFSGRVYVRSLIQQTPHTQLSYSLLQLLTLTQYLWLWNFNQTKRKIWAYNVASKRIHLCVMSTIIVHANIDPIGYIYQDHPNTKCLPKDKMKKGKVKITLTLA